MSESFFHYHVYTDSDDVKKALNHLKNGELLHDCYYDIEGSNDKLAFFNSFKCFKVYGNELMLSSPYEFENKVDDVAFINLLKGQRDSEYFGFVKRTYDCYTVF